MTYPDLLEILRATARTVAPNATYYRGRFSDVSLNSHDANTNLIYALDTMRGQPDADNRFETWRITIGFLRQDSTSSESMEANQQQSNEESREEIFTITHAMARDFFSAVFNDENVMIVGTPEFNQITRTTQGTYSGWSLDFSVLLDVGCEDISIQDAEYKNSDSTFEVSIKRGAVYTAPDIVVTDSDGTEYEHPANKDVVCTPGGGGGSCEYDVFVNGVFYDSVTLTNCEDLTITVP